MLAILPKALVPLDALLTKNGCNLDVNDGVLPASVATFWATTGT